MAERADWVTYSITGPDGAMHSIKGPPGKSRTEVIAAIKERLPIDPVELVPRSAASVYAKDIGAGLVRGAARGLESATTAVPSFLGTIGEFFETPEETAQRASTKAAIAKAREGQGSPSSFVGRYIPAPETIPGEVAESIGEAAGTSPLQPGGPITKAATTVGIGAGSYSGGKVAEWLGLPNWLGSAAGGLVGGVASGGSAQLAAEKKARNILPTAAENRVHAKRAFDMIENAGLVIEPTEAKNFAAGLTADLKKNFYTDAWGHTGLNAADQIAASNGDLATIIGIHNRLGTIKPSADANYASALQARDAIREFIGNLQPNQVLSGDPQFVAELWPRAREAWRITANLEDIQAAMQSAEWRRLASGQGSNLNTMRQEIRKIIDNSNKARRFTPEAREEMERVVEGDVARNVLRQVAAFAPHGSVSSVPTMFVAATHGGGAAAAVGAGLLSLKRLQGVLEERSINQLYDVVRQASPLITRDMIDQRERLLLLNQPMGQGQRVISAAGRGVLSAGAGSPLAAPGRAD